MAGAGYNNATDTDGDGNSGLGDTGAMQTQDSAYQNGHRMIIFVNVSEDDQINNVKS
jgi:hypothetical protein